jgi:F0F1-type ATP synthase beta subunit
MRARSGAINVTSYQELLEEVSFTQMKQRDCSDTCGMFDKFAQLRLEEQELELLDSIKPVQASAKILVLGEAGVGKTSLIRRFVQKVFDESYQPSEG